jgi:hypothetical protein
LKSVHVPGAIWYRFNYQMLLEQT